ncbi:hypothetical protein A1O3_09117 [Capronia epimyces CBS 606.96]|uniref:Zn(2)-C6 fungal-type domain-containing protein n=1 Tax=Capronia epimyces CBS 606.96 TaxID=1182542 RepID=W9XCN7_9EURO|nr:uncharacterized protein A1O3_09117 [Capronia epimyces CBS 606.96]EXJ77958.1 hypothetical protein A1O3_09117 [Capronia epimyces CBS 606.96]
MEPPVPRDGDADADTGHEHEGDPARPSSPTSSPGHVNKRKRTSGMYQRKRAVIACQVCRGRKTKCDNGRPSCGFCLQNGAQCVYPDDTNNYSSYDPASLAILDRVNRVVALLEAQPARIAAYISDKDSRTAERLQTPAQATPGSGQAASQKSPIPLDDPAEDASAETAEHVSRSFDIPESSAAYMNCESVMRWPIFAGIALDIQSLVLDYDDDEAADRSSRDLIDGATGRRGLFAKALQEDDFVPLSRRFLAYVHVKNPILDVQRFKLSVKTAAENGPAWDGPSCLVLVACALGCLASPFQPDPVLYETPESFRSSESPAVDPISAQGFYLAAKKRLGLLRPSLLYVQCLFLFGVFEMYTLRPQRAWFYFQQASLQLQNHLWRKSQIQTGGGLQVADPSFLFDRRLEQRLYWSCMKSECELRCELPLPPSGITRLNFPDLFPSPPTELSSPTTQQRTLDGVDDDVEPEEEKSWFYYLAEISFRRMFNRIVTTVIGKGERGWINNIETIIQQCDQFDEEINIWCSHLPPKINWNDSQASNDELAYYIRGRAMGSREFIHRPFLYYVVHQPPDDRVWPQVVVRARRCLEFCVENALYAYPHQRHHGTWYVARACLTRALLLLAAGRSGKIDLPNRWREAIDLSMLTVQQWYDESPDLRKGASILQAIIDDTFDGVASTQA